MLNTSYFEKIIEENHSIIFKICKIYTSPQDFDDLYQEMLIAIWQGLKKFKGNSKISTWLYKVVLNTALSYQRKESKIAAKNVALQDTDNYNITESTNTDRKEQLYNAMKQLRPEERSIILLYFEDKNNDEIAEIMGITAGNVRVKLSRIRKKLSNIINQQKNG